MNLRSPVAIAALLLTVPAAWAQPSTAGDPASTQPPVPPPPEMVLELHDVRPPVPFHPPWRPIDYLAALGLLLLLAVAATLLALRARSVAPPVLPPAPQDPTPLVLALQRLDGLRAKQLYGAGPRGHLEIARELPFLLKAYLDTVYRSQLIYQTTWESHRALSASLPGPLAEAVTRLLLQCDRVKFAGQVRFAHDPLDEAERVLRAIDEQRTTQGATP